MSRSRAKSDQIDQALAQLEVSLGIVGGRQGLELDEQVQVGPVRVETIGHGRAEEIQAFDAAAASLAPADRIPRP